MRMLLLLGLALVSFSACISLPTTAEAKLSYAAVESSWPTHATCLNKPVMEGFAKEVLVGSLRTVVIAGGDKPISNEAWPKYTPGLGNQKNSARFTLFDRSCFSRSPSKPADCEGDACRDIVNLDGYTWVGLSKIEAADCMPSPSACDGTAVKPGGLLLVVTRKCHEMVFVGEVIFLEGPKGERAVMHATADGRPTTDVTLPAGWTLRRETLPQPLVLHPFGGGEACFYNIIRDHKQQSYHQLTYAGPTYP